MKVSRISSQWAIFPLGLGILASPQLATAQRPLGIDVSSYQKTITWSDVKAGGISFAWTKATEGLSYIDAYFTANESGGKAQGIYMGAYHFAHPESHTPQSEATYFWNEAGAYIKNDGLTFMPMLDFEVFSGYVGATSYADWANQWCSNVVSLAAAQGVSVKPFVYVSACEAGNFNSTIAQWSSDIANYNGESAQTGTPWNECTADESFGAGVWTVWQYNDTASFSGISGQQPDVDVYNGTTNGLLNYVVGYGAAPAGVTLYFDPGAKQASPGSGGIGTWDLNSIDWWYSGASNVDYSAKGDNPIFAGSAGRVTVGAAVTAANLTFQTAGYNLGGSGSITLTNNPAVITVPPPGSSPVGISDPIYSGSYTLTGGGVLFLTSVSNTAVSPVTITTNTTLVIASSAVLGLASGTVNINNGGCLQNNDTTAGHAFINSNVNIVLGAGGGYLNDNGSSSLAYGGIISGFGNMTKIGGGGGTGGTLILNGANTYYGNTLISQGILALGAGGSINNSPLLTLAAGASLDVSATNWWTLSGSTVFAANGTGTTIGSTAATLKGAAAGIVSLGVSPILLTFKPTSANGDTTHPPLYISQGTLSLDYENSLTISNAATTPLRAGVYTLIQQAGGAISNTAYPVPYIIGAGVAAGTVSNLAVNGGALNLIIADTTTTALGALSPSTYGQPVTFTATVSPAPSGGTMQFYDNGSVLGGGINVNTNDGTASYTTSALAVGSHPITAAYSGVTLYTASTTAGAQNQQINPASMMVAAMPQSKRYGTTLAFGGGSTNFTAVGLGNNSISSVTLAISGNGGAATAPVGTYTIMPSAAVGPAFTPANYNITYNPGMLTVTLPSNSIPVNITNATRLPDGTVQLSFSGTPGYVYWVEAATNLVPPITWTIIGTNAADASGQFSFTDQMATNGGARFYRTQAQ